jgi:hypothetical protein
VRLGHQPTGSLFAPLRGRVHTDEETPQVPRGPALPPHEPADTSHADAGPADTSPAGASPAGGSPPEKSPAETRPADVTPADARSADAPPVDARPADNGAAEADQADAHHAARPPERSPSGVGPPEADPAEAGPAGAEPAEASPAGASASPAETEPPEDKPSGKDQDKAGPPPGSAGLPLRVPARQGLPPKPAPGGTGAVPAPRPGGVPATRPGSVPAARPGAVPARRQAAAPPARRPAAQPSWGAVLATTFRLWAVRRMQRTRWRVLIGLVAAVLLFAAGALTVTLIKGTQASNSSGTSQGGGTAEGGTQGSLGGALASVAAARKQAANWVASQVNPDENIGCDPVMCTALQAAHIQANRLIMLGPGEPDPLGSEILLDTATLRAQFGPRLESVYAPVSLAAFGSGAARVEVRFMAPNSAHIYLGELARDVAARKAAGTEMLRNHFIHASPLARHQLIAGRVDTRLLVTLVTLAHSHPVDIISFGTHQPGASPGVPLRSAEIAGAPGPGSTPAVSVQTLRSFLSVQQPPYRPSAIVAVKTASRRTVLRVEYPAPSLLGLLGPHG